MLTVNDIADIIYDMLAAGGELPAPAEARAANSAAVSEPKARGEAKPKYLSWSLRAENGPLSAKPAPEKAKAGAFKSGYGTGFYKGLAKTGESGQPEAFGAKGGRYYGPAARPGKIFLTDRALRCLLAPGAKVLTIPRGSLISPLAQDWIDFDGIELRFE